MSKNLYRLRDKKCAINRLVRNLQKCNLYFGKIEKLMKCRLA